MLDVDVMLCYVICDVTAVVVYAIYLPQRKNKSYFSVMINGLCYSGVFVYILCTDACM